MPSRGCYKFFQKFISKYKGKFVSPSKKSPEGFIDNALIKEVSANTVDMYFTSQATEYGSKLIVLLIWVVLFRLSKSSNGI